MPHWRHPAKELLVTMAAVNGALIPTTAPLDIPAEGVRCAVADSFTQWRTLVSQSFVPLEVRSESPTFHGTLRSRVLDELSIVEVTANGHQVLRTPTLIAASTRQYFKLNLQLTGSGLLVQDNREATLRPGDLAVYDTNRPYTLEFDQDFRTLVLMFPHDVLDLPADSVGQLTAVRLPGDAGLGRLISPFMVQLAENLDVLSGASGHRLAYNAVDLIATMFESELNQRRDPEAGAHGDLLGRIRSYVDAHLGDPELGPASIAAARPAKPPIAALSRNFASNASSSIGRASLPCGSSTRAPNRVPSAPQAVTHAAPRGRDASSTATTFARNAASAGSSTASCSKSSTPARPRKNPNAAQ